MFHRRSVESLRGRSARAAIKACLWVAGKVVIVDVAHGLDREAAGFLPAFVSPMPSATTARRPFAESSAVSGSQ